MGSSILTSIRERVRISTVLHGVLRHAHPFACAARTFEQTLPGYSAFKTNQQCYQYKVPEVAKSLVSGKIFLCTRLILTCSFSTTFKGLFIAKKKELSNKD